MMTDDNQSSASGASETRAPGAGGASPGVGFMDFSNLPDDTKIDVIPIAAYDGGTSRGILYSRGGERTVVCFSHPRADLSRAYWIPQLLEAGYAAYCHQCRGLNNDIDAVHETLLLDLAAGFDHLKSQLGFEKLILLGNSGGGSLALFYQQQARLSAPTRLKETPAGDPCYLNAVTMPKADGVMLFAIHPGEGEFMMNNIDPAVVDEADPLCSDPSLDMYNPDNGYRTPPEASSYAEEFVTRYRDAQRARVRRLDERAKAFIADQKRYEKRLAEPAFAELPATEQQQIRRGAATGRYMILYRTEANLAYCDLHLHSWRSTRKVGSLIGPDPERLNYGPGGFARYLTPRAWLSSWSGLSTRADVQANIATLQEPLLMISYTSDNACFPEHNRKQVEACPATDKTHEFIEADHFGYPVAQRQNGGAIAVRWLKERFP